MPKKTTRTCKNCLFEDNNFCLGNSKKVILRNDNSSRGTDRYTYFKLTATEKKEFSCNKHKFAIYEKDTR